MADLKAFAEQLVNLTVKEVNELATILKEEYGIEPAAAETQLKLPTAIDSVNKLTTTIFFIETTPFHFYSMLE